MGSSFLPPWWLLGSEVRLSRLCSKRFFFFYMLYQLTASDLFRSFYILTKNLTLLRQGTLKEFLFCGAGHESGIPTNQARALSMLATALLSYIPSIFQGC